MEKTNFYISVSDGKHVGTGEIAPNIRYHESETSVINNFNSFLEKPLEAMTNINQVTDFLNLCDFSNAVRFGIESAALHFLSKKYDKDVSDLLKIPSMPGKTNTCYTIPIMPCEDLKAFINDNNLKRFHSLKVKINKETAEESIKAISKLTSQRLKIDANEGFSEVDDFLIFANKLKNLPIDFIEQPFPSSFVEEYKFVKNKSPFKLFADESVQNQIDYVTVSQQFHGINIKLMKTGSFIKALSIIEGAKRFNLKTMIGCMVESTLGISCAMYLAALVDYADLDGHFIIENEPFDLVGEENGQLFLK